jgi:hypothetical protein
MENMDASAINRKMAVEVMGWRQIEGWAKWWFPKTEPVTLADAITDWDPYHRWDHAMMALEKLKPKCRQIIIEYKSRFYSNGDSWWVTIQLISGVWISQIMADTIPAAICLACLEAVKECSS